jgi:type II secretory pathway pseudopilin PulG
MTMIELMVSTTLLGLVVAGATSSAILFAKIAADHENRADFNNDIRSGIERMSFDIRNASGITDRQQQQFELTFPDGSTVVYEWQQNNKRVVRKEGGSTDEVLGSISSFDVLVGESDEPADGALTFASEELSIEELSFQAARGGAGNTGFTVKNITFATRNGP